MRQCSCTQPWWLFWLEGDATICLKSSIRTVVGLLYNDRSAISRQAKVYVTRIICALSVYILHQPRFSLCFWSVSDPVDSPRSVSNPSIVVPSSPDDSWVELQHQCLCRWHLRSSAHSHQCPPISDAGLVHLLLHFHLGISLRQLRLRSPKCILSGKRKRYIILLNHGV